MLQAHNTMIDARSGAFITSVTKKPRVCCHRKVLSYQGILVEATFQDHWTEESTKVVNDWFANKEKRSSGEKVEREPHVNNQCEIGWISEFDGIDTALVTAMDSVTLAKEHYEEAEKEKTRCLEDMEAASDAFGKKRRLN